MTKLILIEILAVPAERSRGRHNPRVVKRKMSNFPTKSRSAASAAPSQCLRYDKPIVIVAPPEPIAPTTAGRKPAAPTASQPAQTSRQTFWQVQAWRASGLSRAVFCQQHNLSPRAFNAAVARLRQTFRHARKNSLHSASVNRIGFRSMMPRWNPGKTQPGFCPVRKRTEAALVGPATVIPSAAHMFG